MELIKPKDSIYHIAVEKSLLPTQRVRWCCEAYKENAGAGKVTLIGIRHQESTRRAKRNEVEISSRKFSGTFEGFEQYREDKLSKQRRPKKGINITNATGERTVGCISGKESLLISPIIHWTERDVWEFLNKVCRVQHCSLYDEGRRRIGCICCPMSNHRSKYQDIQRWPHVKRNWIKAIIAIRRGGGIAKRNYRFQPCGTVLVPTGSQSPSRIGGYIAHPAPMYWTGGFSESSSPDGLTEEQEWEIAENIFDWWISGKSYKKWYADMFLQLKLKFTE